MLMPLHWSSEVAETFPGLPSTPALKFSRGELNWQNSIPLRTSGTPAGLLHPALLGFFSLPAVWATGRQPRLASYLQHSTAQYLDLCLMVLSLVAGEKGGDKVDGDLLSSYCKPDNS